MNNELTSCAEELRNCRPYLHAELDLLPSLRVVCLVTLRERGHAIPHLPFKHGACYEPGQGLPVVIASYHPSRQNTNTGLLTEPTLDVVFTLARAELER